MGWTILLIVLTVLAVIFLLPVRVKASFGDGKWSVRVYYCFIRLFRKESEIKPPPETPPLPDLHADTQPQSVPEPAQTAEKPPEPVKPPKPEAAAEAGQQTETKPEKPKKKGPVKRFIERVKPHSLSDVLGLIKDGGASLSASLRFLLRHFHFRHVKLYTAVASDDAAKTAQLYGKICAGAFNLLGQMQCLFDMQVDEFRILADFFNEKTTFRAALELRVSPAVLLLTALKLGGKFLWRTVRRFRREDREAKRRARESAPLPSAGT